MSLFFTSGGWSHLGVLIPLVVVPLALGGGYFLKQCRKTKVSDEERKP